LGLIIIRLFTFFCLIFVFFLKLYLSDPCDFHLLTASVFKEELFWNNFVCVFCSKINVFKILLAEQSRADTLSTKVYF